MGFNRESPKISVILPVYNSVKYLAETIDSILNQTYTNFELIIINDASTDNSEKIIEKYQDERIKYIKNETNMGVAYSSNRGIEIAAGKYIAKADSDDIYDYERLEKQLQVMEENSEYNICVFDMSIIDAKGNLIGEWNYNHSSDYLKAKLLFDSPLPNPTVMFRNNIFKELNCSYDESLKIAEDYDLFVQMDNEFKVIHIPECLVKYRRHESNLTNNDIRVKTDANTVRLKMLNRIGISPSFKEFEIHKALCGDFYNLDNFELTKEALCEWINKLLKQNILINYCLEENLKELIVFQLSNLYEYLSKKNHEIWYDFWEYELVKQSKLPELIINIDNFNVRFTDKIAIFGTKRTGIFLYNKFREKGYKIEYFIDNYCEFSELLGVKVIRQNDLLLDYKVDVVILTVLGKHEKEIRNSLVHTLSNRIRVIGVYDFLQ